MKDFAAPAFLGLILFCAALINCGNSGVGQCLKDCDQDYSNCFFSGLVWGVTPPGDKTEPLHTYLFCEAAKRECENSCSSL